jgi:hypothetical protein
MEKYSSLDSIIRQLLLEQGETTERRYPTFLAYGYAFLNGEYPAQQPGGKALKTTLFEVGVDGTAEIPIDFVSLVSLGRVVGNRVRNLAYNDRLAPPGTSGTDAAGYADLGYTPQPAWPSISYWGWQSLGLTGWDGWGYGWGEFEEEFAIDATAGILRVSSALAGQNAGLLLLQYQSNDLAPGKPTPIHPFWQQALKSWLLWNWYLKAKENVSLAREHEKLYKSERKKAISRTDPTNVYDEIIKQVSVNYNTLR